MFLISFDLIGLVLNYWNTSTIQLLLSRLNKTRVILLSKSIVFLVALAMLAMPILALRRSFSVLQNGLAYWAAMAVALSGWICWFYSISIFSLPANLFMWIPLGLTVVVIFRGRLLNMVIKPAVLWVGLLVLLPYLLGYVLSNLLPGCDTAMHG